MGVHLKPEKTVKIMEIDYSKTGRARYLKNEKEIYTERDIYI